MLEPNAMFDAAPAAAALAEAWRTGRLLTELPAPIRPRTLAEGYDVQDQLVRPDVPDSADRRSQTRSSPEPRWAAEPYRHLDKDANEAPSPREGATRRLGRRARRQRRQEGSRKAPPRRGRHRSRYGPRRSRRDGAGAAHDASEGQHRLDRHSLEAVRGNLVQCRHQRAFSYGLRFRTEARLDKRFKEEGHG